MAVQRMYGLAGGSPGRPVLNEELHRRKRQDMDVDFSLNFGSLSQRMIALAQSALNDVSSWVHSVLGIANRAVGRKKRNVDMDEFDLHSDDPVLRQSRRKGMEEELRNLLTTYSEISDMMNLKTVSYGRKRDFMTTLSRMRSRIRYLMWELYHGEVHHFDGYHINWMQLFPSGWSNALESSTPKPVKTKTKKKKSKRNKKKKGRKNKKKMEKQPEEDVLIEQTEANEQATPPAKEVIIADDPASVLNETVVSNVAEPKLATPPAEEETNGAEQVYEYRSLIFFFVCKIFIQIDLQYV